MNKGKQLKRKYHLFNCADTTLGRVATRIAFILQGKHLPTYEPNSDSGDFAVAVNISMIKLSGNKSGAKVYHTFSGYPGGIRTDKFSGIMEKNPDRVLREAVYNMLPKNKLRDRMIKRLLMFKSEKHGIKGEFAA